MYCLFSKARGAAKLLLKGTPLTERLANVFLSGPWKGRGMTIRAARVAMDRTAIDHGADSPFSACPPPEGAVGELTEGQTARSRRCEPLDHGVARGPSVRGRKFRGSPASTARCCSDHCWGRTQGRYIFEVARHARCRKLDRHGRRCCFGDVGDRAPPIPGTEPALRRQLPLPLDASMPRVLPALDVPCCPGDRQSCPMPRQNDLAERPSDGDAHSRCHCSYRGASLSFVQ